MDEEPEQVQNAEPIMPQSSPQELARLLDRYGHPGNVFAIPERHLPLSQKVIDVASRYQEVHFDPLIKVFDRSLMQNPFDENPEFLQVGNWGDGSEVLVKRQSEDPKVYVAFIEDGDPQHPSVLAESFDEYMFKALKDYEEANVIMQRHANG